MVTAFPCFGTPGQLQTGYKSPCVPHGHKKTRRSGLVNELGRITCWQVPRQRARRQPGQQQGVRRRAQLLQLLAGQVARQLGL